MTQAAISSHDDTATATFSPWHLSHVQGHTVAFEFQPTEEDLWHPQLVHAATAHFYSTAEMGVQNPPSLGYRPHGQMPPLAASLQQYLSDTFSISAGAAADDQVYMGLKIIEPTAHFPRPISPGSGTIRTGNIRFLHDADGRDADSADIISNIHAGQTEDWFHAIDAATNIYSAKLPTYALMCRFLSEHQDSQSESSIKDLSPQKGSHVSSLIAKLIHTFKASQTRFSTDANSDPSQLPHLFSFPVPVPANQSLRKAVLQEFANGIEGQEPSPETLQQATMLIEAAAQKTEAYEFDFDDTDGALTFELRLSNSYLVMGELSNTGTLRANVYNDQYPNDGARISDIWVHHLPKTSAEDLINLF